MTHVERDVVTRALATAADWELEGVCGESFLSLNATLMRAYMDKYGVGAERFAPFAITAHRNALTNPNALLHKAARSRDLSSVARRHGSDSPVRRFAGLQRRERRHPRRAARGRGAARPQPRANRRLGARDRAARARAAPRSARADGRDELDAAGDEAGRRRPRRHRSLRAARRLHDHDRVDARGGRLRAARRGPRLRRLASASACAASCRSRRSAASKRAAIPSARAAAIRSSKRSCSSRERAGANQVPDAGVALVQNIGGTGATVVSHVLTRED